MHSPFYFLSDWFLRFRFPEANKDFRCGTERGTHLWVTTPHRSFYKFAQDIKLYTCYFILITQISEVSPNGTGIFSVVQRRETHISNQQPIYHSTEANQNCSRNEVVHLLFYKFFFYITLLTMVSHSQTGNFNVLKRNTSLIHNW